MVAFWYTLEESQINIIVMNNFLSIVDKTVSQELSLIFEKYVLM